MVLHQIIIQNLKSKIESLAKKSGVTSAELAYEILMENVALNIIELPDLMHSVCQKMLEDKNAIMGLGDGGAHVGFILDAGYPTWLISYWSVKKESFFNGRNH